MAERMPGENKKRHGVDTDVDQNGVDDSEAEMIDHGHAAMMSMDEGKQDPRERRQLRHKYRNLGDDLHKKQHDLTKPQNTELQQKLKEINCLFKEVRMTREAAMDAQVVAIISNLARQQAQSFHAEFTVFQPSEFAEKLVTFVSGPQLAENPSERQHITAEGWQNLGAAVQPYFRRSPALHFMYGSFEREKPVRKDPKAKTQRAKDKDAVADKQTVPTQLKCFSETDRNEATTEEVDRIYGILQQYYEDWNRQPICYFEFVVNPNSFGQTVENIFYTSFLIRDNLARIFLDDDKLPVIEPIENNGDKEDEEAKMRHQVVFSLNIKQWQDIKKTFNIQEPLIPTRERLAGEPQNSQESSSTQDVGSQKKRKR